MGKFLLFLVCFLSVANTNAATRFNPTTRLWEGNICMTQRGWGWHGWAPIGSICAIRTPLGVVYGVIANN